MIYAFDIDGTICTITDGEYKDAKPLQIRIDEVNESGEAKIKENKGQVSPFPLNIQPSNSKE